MPDYRISTILKKIEMHYDLTRDNVLSYNEFKKIMMADESFEPVMTYERTVKEKYKLMQDFKIISWNGILIGDVASKILEERLKRDKQRGRQ